MFKAKLMSQLIDKFINISKYFANWLIVKVVLKKKKTIILWFQPFQFEDFTFFSIL